MDAAEASAYNVQRGRSTHQADGRGACPDDDPVSGSGAHSTRMFGAQTPPKLLL